MYESHITVANIEDAEFLSICENLNVKPVIIEQDTGSGRRQMMTARFHKTDDLQEALNEMHDLADRFDHVIRRKLEKIVRRNDDLPSHLYLEFHLKYEVDKSEVENFVSSVASAGGHTSRNMVKQTKKDSSVYIFASARTEEVFDKLCEILNSYQRINVIRECVVFDDNPSIDTGWCGCECKLKTYLSSF